MDYLPPRNNPCKILGSVFGSPPTWSVITCHDWKFLKMYSKWIYWFRNENEGKLSDNAMLIHPLKNIELHTIRDQYLNVVRLPWPTFRAKFHINPFRAFGVTPLRNLQPNLTSLAKETIVTQIFKHIWRNMALLFIQETVGWPPTAPVPHCHQVFLSCWLDKGQELVYLIKSPLHWEKS